VLSLFLTVFINLMIRVNYRKKLLKKEILFRVSSIMADIGLSKNLSLT
jgi:hypothetical protein